MKENSGRRSFIKNVSMGSISAAILPVSFATATNPLPENEQQQNLSSPQKNKRLYNSAYQGENLNRVAFAVGGLGAGMFCMEGTGAISHVSVRNKPEIFNEPDMFAAIAVKGKKTGLNCWKARCLTGKNLASGMQVMAQAAQPPAYHISGMHLLLQNFLLIIWISVMRIFPSK